MFTIRNSILHTKNYKWDLPGRECSLGTQGPMRSDKSLSVCG